MRRQLEFNVVYRPRNVDNLSEQPPPCDVRVVHVFFVQSNSIMKFRSLLQTIIKLTSPTIIVMNTTLLAIKVIFI
ncbi:CLUMA_CG019800, isoform A [Clunio marinus]|uniref:CLUMA_CG019800, isoform A n=1 Tax=Clunio marinus TaxID=568069 RepID=A0A1J1J429_9DIPT|nr:CLUMA_CG019800, isoform A [Clunio marinus]